MADVSSNINVNINTTTAMAQIRALQSQLTSLNRSLVVGSKEAAHAQKQFAASLLHNVNATGQFRASVSEMTTVTEQFSNRLDKGKLSLKEYFRYAGSTNKRFGKNFTSEYLTTTKLVEKRVKTLQTQYVQLGRNAQGAMQSMKFIPKSLNMSDLNTQLMLGIQRKQIFNKLIDDGSTKLLNFGKNTQWAGRQLMVGFTIPLALLGATAVKTFKEIETQALRFKKVYGDAFTNTEETNEALKNIKDLAKEYSAYGLTIANTMKTAADAAQQGASGANLIAQVREANKLAVLGGVEQEQALETTVSLTNSFGLAADELANKINFLNAVENQTILSLEDITKAAPIAGNVIKQLGGNVEDLAFFLTAMREGGINANQGANALKSGLARLINPTNSAVKKLKGFGIDLLGIVEENTGNVRGAVLDLAVSLEALGSIDRARAIETIFGKYQFTRISTLLQNVVKQGGQAARVLEVSRMEAEELAILSEREMKMQADSPMNKLASAIEKLKVQLAPIGELFAKILVPIVAQFEKLLNWFNSFPEGVKKAIGIVIGVVAGLGPIFLMTFGLLGNAFANVIKLVQILRKGYANLAYGSSDAALRTQYLTNEELENSAITNSLYGQHQRLSATYQLESSALQALTIQYQRANAAMKSSIAQRPGMFVSPIGKGPKPFNSGTLSVPGTGNTDTVPAMLTPGEAVVPKKQSKKYRGLLSSIIADRVPGFRLGGIIGQSMMRTSGGVAASKLGIPQSGMGAATSGSRFYNATQLPGNKIQLEIPSGTGSSIKVIVDKSDKFSIDKILEENATFYSTSAKFGKPKTQNKISHIQDPSGKLYYVLTRKGFANRELSLSDIRSIRNKMPIKDASRTRKLTSEIKDAKARILSSKKSEPSREFFAKEIKDAEAYFVYGMRMTKEQFNKKIIGPASKNQDLDAYLSNIKSGGGGLASAHIVSRKSLKKLGLPEDEPNNIMLESAFINRAYKNNIAPHTPGTAKALITKLERSTSDESKIAAYILKQRIKSNFYKPDSELNIRYSDAAKYNLGTLAAGLSSQRINTLTAKWSQTEYRKRFPELSNNDPLHGPLFIGKHMKPRQNVKEGGALQGSNIMYTALRRSTMSPAFLTGTKKDRAKYLLEQYMRGDYMALQAPGASRILSSLAKRKSGTFFRGINLSGNSDIARNMSPLPKSLLTELQKAQKSGDFSKIVGKTFSVRRSSWSENKNISSDFGSFTIKANIKDKSVIPASEMFPGIKFAKPGFKETVSEKESLFGGRFKVVAANKNSMEIQGYNQGAFSVPGPNVNKDVVPAMLTPGEAVIPRDQAKKYRPLISGIIADRVPGFNQGTDGLSKAARGRITNAVQQQQKLLRQQNKYTEQQIQDSLRRFKKQKAQEELAAANSRRKAQLDRETIKNQEAKATQDKATKKNARQQRRMAFSQKFAGPGMGLAFGVPMIAGAMAAKNPEGAIAQNMMPIMLASMIPMLLPLFTSIPMMISGAVAAVVGGIWMYKKKQDDAVKEQARLVDEISATTEKMKAVSQITGRVGASELMSRRREGTTGDFSFTERKGISFGSTFLQSEPGKLDLETFQKRFELMPDRAMREFALRLASYVSDGVLETSQAAEIANQIGVELGNQQVAVEINGKLRKLLTFDGKDITKEPFEIRLQIARETIGQLSEFIDTGSANQRLDQIAKETVEITRGVSDYRQLQNDPRLKALAIEAEAIKQQIKAQTAQAGALAAQGFEAIRAQIDAIEVSSDKEIEKLETLKKQTKDLEKQQKIQEQIDRIERNRALTINKLENANKQVLRSLNTAYDLAKENKDLNTFFVGLDEAVKNKFKGTGQEVQAKQFNALAANLGEVPLRATIQTQVASGLLNPLQASGLLTAFVNDNEELNKVLNLFIKGSGIENLNRLQSIVGTFEDKQLSKDILLKFGGFDSKEFETAYSTLELLNNMNMEELNLEEFLRIDNGKAFNDLTITLQKIEDMPDKITKEAVVELFTQQNGINLGAGRQGAAKDFIADWEYLNSLPENIRKTAVQTYLSIFSTMFTSKEAREQFASEQAGVEARQETRNLDKIEKRAKVITNTYVNSDSAGDFTAKGFKKAAQDAAKYTEDIIGEFLAIGNQTDKTKNKIEGSGKLESSFLDDFLKKLRDVRDETIKVTKGFDASIKALKEILGKKQDIKIFDGIEQQLARIGMTDDFISYIIGMDPKEYEEKKKSLFNFKNGKIVGLLENANVIQKALAEIALGDFQTTQLKLIGNVNNQTVAVRRLVAAGVSATDAYKGVEDAAFAAAVANKDLTDAELKKIVDVWNKASKAVEIYTAKAALAGKNQDFANLKRIPEAIGMMKKQFGNLPESVVQAIIDDANLRTLILNGKFNAPEALQALQDAANDEEIRIKIKMQTKEGMQELFDEGYSKAMEYFDARESEIELRFNFKTLNDQNIIQAAEDSISAIEYKLDDLQASLLEFEDKEDGINKKYDDRIEALDQIEKLNDGIADKQRAQISIADALTQGDISAAAKAVQDLKEKQASDALEQQKESIESARELELSSIRNTAGQSRIEIEKQIKDLQNEIFAIEEKTLEPARERIRLAEIEKREAIEQLTLLDKSKLVWESIKNSIDLARTSSQSYMESIKNSLALVSELIQAWGKIENKQAFIEQIENIKPVEDQVPTSPEDTSTPDPGENPRIKELRESINQQVETNEKIKNRIETGKIGPKALEHLQNQLKQGRARADSLRAELRSLLNPVTTGGSGGFGSGSNLANAYMANGGKVKYMPMGGLIPYMAVGGMIKMPKSEPPPAQKMNMGGKVNYMPMGGLIPYMNMGGIFKPKGTDTVPAMLTPGEFVVRKYAVKDFGVDKLKAINEGTYNDGSVYNYNLNLNVKSESNADQIAETVIAQIKRIDSQRIRGNRN